MAGTVAHLAIFKDESMRRNKNKKALRFIELTAARVVERLRGVVL